MNQFGKVIEVVDKDRAKILMTKHTACGDCGACQHGKENMSLCIVASNNLGAKVGDMVEVNMETPNVLGAAFIVYVIPLFLMLVGIIGGNFALKALDFSGNIEVYSAFIGFILLTVSFIGIKLFESTFQRNVKYVPVISKILD